MKTWQEWKQEYDGQRFSSSNQKRILVHGDGSYIKAIQLDAYKQGMTDAAEIMKRDCDENSGCGVYKAILSARDNKTTI